LVTAVYPLKHKVMIPMLRVINAACAYSCGPLARLLGSL
jgi:hypothetical protein